MEKLFRFIKAEPVLIVSIALAVISCFFVTPTADYFSYIDYKTLAVLFCLMLVMAGFKGAGLFSFCAERLLRVSKSNRSTLLTLTLLCFFFSAAITNDVALITFVPFTITLLRLAGRVSLIPTAVILETVAANMGSALTPIGNPQNIYLFSISGLGALDILKLMLPYAVITLCGLLFIILCIKDAPVGKVPENIKKIDVKITLFYAIMFIISLLAVFGVIDYLVCLILVGISVLIFDRGRVLNVDYSLLLTFVGFFIFVGNMGEIGPLKELIAEWFSGREVFFSAVISQAISNVPAALLLSGFTDNYSDLLVGVNIGGLGTLIASMASLISYKYIARELPDKKGRYLRDFSALNFIMLAALLGFNMLF